MGDTSVDQVREILSRCSYKWDDREEPHKDHRARFLSGWRDALGRRAPYKPSTFDRLHWQNLGYRFGEELRDRGQEEIYEIFAILADLWREIRSLPGDVDADGPLVEGAVMRVSVNAYERNPIARQRCIEHYGARCFICAFDFGEVYGRTADGFIHVHHLVPLSEVSDEYEVDPIADLRPICPNCHAVLHLGGRTRTVEEVKALIAEKRRR
jgi:hypothetical protein